MTEDSDKLTGLNNSGDAGKSRLSLLFIGIGYIVQLNAGICLYGNSFLKSSALVQGVNW